MTRLTGPDFYCWLALRRVRRGGVARFNGRYYDSGRPVPGYLVPDALAALLEQELLQRADPDAAGMRRVALTVAGQARYTALEHQQRAGSAPTIAASA